MIAGVPYGLPTVHTTRRDNQLCDLAAPAALTFLEEMRARDGLERLALSQVLIAPDGNSYAIAAFFPTCTWWKG